MTDPPPTDPAPGRGRRAKEVLAAAAAGHGAEELRRRGHGRLVAAGWGACFLLFALSALFIMSGRHELISVILESRRWPFPFRL